MPAEQQLVDYIKKAKDAGQVDSQTRNLLLKNGWTGAEIDDAFSVLTPQETQPEPEPQPQPAMQPKPQPQMQQVQPQMMQSNMPRIRKSHAVLKFLMVLIIVVVLGGIGFYAAGQYFNFSFNFFTPSPTTVINKMLATMENVKSYQEVLQGNIITTSNKNTPQGQLSFSATFGSDVTNINNSVANLNFNINVTQPGSALPIASANANAIVSGGALYLKINKITTPPAFSYAGMDFSKLTGIWFKIDQDSVAAIPDISQVNVSTIKQIQNIVLAENLLSNVKQLGSQIVGGTDTYHYSITISKEKISDLLSKIMALQPQGSTINSVVTPFVNSVGDINVEIWIGKKDYLLYQINLNKTIAQLEIKINAMGSNFNKPISVQAPTTFSKVEDIVLPLLKIQKISTDIMQIGVMAQSVFVANKSYLSLCTHGLLNGYLTTYGADLVNLNNNIVSQGGKKPVCLAGIQNFCISAQLADGSYLCVDKSDIVGKTKCVSFNTACK